VITLVIEEKPGDSLRAWEALDICLSEISGLVIVHGGTVKSEEEGS
jgi:hypothetical protein